jgi:hypothetical protein
MEQTYDIFINYFKLITINFLEYIVYKLFRIVYENNIYKLMIQKRNVLSSIYLIYFFKLFTN